MPTSSSAVCNAEVVCCGATGLCFFLASLVGPRDMALHFAIADLEDSAYSGYVGGNTDGSDLKSFQCHMLGERLADRA